MIEEKKMTEEKGKGIRIGMVGEAIVAAVEKKTGLTIEEFGVEHKEIKKEIEKESFDLSHPCEKLHNKIEQQKKRAEEIKKIQQDSGLVVDYCEAVEMIRAKSEILSSLKITRIDDFKEAEIIAQRRKNYLINEINELNTGIKKLLEKMPLLEEAAIPLLILRAKAREFEKKLKELKIEEDLKNASGAFERILVHAQIAGLVIFCAKSANPDGLSWRNHRGETMVFAAAKIISDDPVLDSFFKTLCQTRQQILAQKRKAYKERQRDVKNFLIKKDDNKEIKDILSMFYLPELIKGRMDGKVLLPVIGDLYQYEGHDGKDRNIKENNHYFGVVIVDFKSVTGNNKVEIRISKADNVFLAKILFRHRNKEGREEWKPLSFFMKGGDVSSVRHGLIRESLQRALNKTKTGQMNAAIFGPHPVSASEADKADYEYE
jgi:hypothetical protein